MQVLGIDHIVVAVPDLEGAVDRYQDRLNVAFGGLIDSREFEDPSQRQGTRARLSGVGIELIEPTGLDHHITRFLERSGPGVYAVILAVADIETAREELTEQGIEPVNHGHHQDGEYWMEELIYAPGDFLGVMVGLIEHETPHPVERPVLGGD